MHWLTAVFLVASGVVVPTQHAITMRVTATTEAINATVGASSNIVVETNRDASVTLTVTTIDGNVVRALPPVETQAGATATLRWDGRDDTGEIVPDGAYRLGIVAVAGRESTTWPDDSGPSEVQEITPRYYDRQRGVLGYQLPEASLVTIEAIAEVDGTSATFSIARSSPRTAGSIIEHWIGRTPSGVRLSELPGFAIRIRANTLGPGWVITYGGRTPAGEEAIR